MAFTYLLYRLQYDDLSGDRVEVTIHGDPSWSPRPSADVPGIAYLEYPEVKNIQEPIRASALQLDLQAIDGETFDILWTENERQFLVTLEIDSQVYFKGFIKPDGIYQDWTKENYDISIDCVGGLGFLEDLSYVDSAGLPFSGLQTPIEIIANCLKRTDLELVIKTIPNIVYDGLTETLDVLANSKHKVDRYVRDDQDTIMSCKEVLEELLYVYGMCVCQHEGEWWVFDPEVIAAGSTTTDYFQYDKDGASTGSGDFDPNVTLGSEINSASVHHINRNQRLETRPSLSGVRVNYKYGLDESLIDNEFLAHDDVSYVGWTINDATKHDFGDNGRGAKISHDESVLVMSADAVTVAEGDQVRLVFIVENKIAPSAERIFSWRARIGNNNYVKSVAGLGAWQSSAYTNAFPVQFNQRAIFAIELEAIPTAGSLIVELFGFEFSTTTQGNLQVQAVQLTPNAAGAAEVEGENHTVQIAGGSVSEDVIEVANGDNVSDLYYGTIYENDGATPTTIWNRLGDTEEKAILRLAAEKFVRMNQKPARYFSGDVYNHLGYLNLFDITNVDSKMMVLGYRLDTKKRIATMVFRQIFDTELSGEIYELTFDYGNTVKPTVVG